MQAFNLVFVVLFAVSALQCQGAEIQRSADKVDLRLFVENGAAIAKNMFKAINTGLDQSKPHMDKILNELAPEAKALARKAIDKARAKLNEEDQRITHIFATLLKALDTLKPIKPCYDKISPEAKKLALATEKEIVKIYLAAKDKYKKEIENVEVGIEKTLKKARNLFDVEVAAVVKCLTPGKKDAGSCLDKEIEKILQGVTDVVTDVIFLIDTAQETLSPLAGEIIQNMLPLLKKVVANGRVILKSLTDCVAALK